MRNVSDLNKSSFGKPLLFSFLAAVFFVPLFAFRKIGGFDFWWWMSANQVLIIGLSLMLVPEFRREIADDLKYSILKKIFLGIAYAAVLYGIFFVGNVVSRQLFPFAAQGIDSIYGFKESASGLRIFLLMVLLIGPGEEIFWRGFLQKRWEKVLSPVKAWLLVSLIYAAVHTASGNIMLVLAAAVCGLFWGWLYLRYKSVLLVVVSHTLWDVIVFIFFGFQG